MTPPSVAVVVVTHNSAATLSRCLQALRPLPDVAEVVVVDNGSTDHWREMLPDGLPLTLIANADNPGFATACNQGAAASTARWLLFLNPDCFLDADALRALLQAAVGVPALGVLGAELVDQDGRVDPASMRSTPTPLAVLRGQRPPAPTLHEVGSPQVQRVDAISGALMLIPRDAFDAVGGFDPGYRLHCEDLDLCRRLLAAERTVAIARGVRIVHLRGSSSRARPLWVEWQKHRGMLRYFRKFDAPRSSLAVRLLVPLAIALRLPLAAGRAWWRARMQSA